MVLDQSAWVDTPEFGYDSRRYCPDEQNDECGVCGTGLCEYDDGLRFTVGCPRCGVMVYTFNRATQF